MAPLAAIMASAAAASIAARDFSYHTNSVRIRDTMKYVDPYFPTTDVVQSPSSFVVTQVSVSPGQDPQTKNRVGDVHYTSMIKGSQDDSGLGVLVDYKEKNAAYPGFSFTVGRHKTADVATFWNARFPPLQNTFNHTADALNFAFVGDMTLTTHECGTMQFHDIGLAQGSDDNGSNWWFGGINCAYIGDNKVNCAGVDENGLDMSADFRRGGAGQIYDVFLERCYEQTAY